MAHGSRFEDETRSSAHRLIDDTRRSGTVDKSREGDQEAGRLFHKAEGEAEQVFGDRVADLRQDQDALKPGVQKGGHRAGEGLRSASHAVREPAPKDKGGVERDGRNFAGIAAADMPILVGQTAREFHRGANGPKAGLQGTTHAAVLPHASTKIEIESVEHDLIGDVRKAENVFLCTELGQEVERGGRELMRDAHKLEHEFPHIDLGQEIRKGGAKLMEEFPRVENEMADTGLGEGVQKGELHLEDEFHKLEYDQHKLGLGQDLLRGERDLKAGMHKVADHLHSDEQAIGRGAEAASRSVEQGIERLGRSDVKGAAIAGGLGTMVLDHALSANHASSPGPNVRRPSHGIISPKDQRTPGNAWKPSTGEPHPQGVSGLHLAPNAQSCIQPPASIQRPPSIVEPPHPPPAQTPQPGYNHGPSGSQQPHLSQTPA